MDALFTGSPVRAEAGQIKPTKSPPDVSFAASGPEGAEATIVVRAWREDVRWIAVEIDAVGGVGTIKGAAVVRAVWHTASNDKINFSPYYHYLCKRKGNWGRR